MSRSVIVLGAGMVGLGTALHLQARGCAVCLIDRSLPGQATSLGNAGLIQTEAVEPYAFPRNPQFLWRSLLELDPDIRWRWQSVWASRRSLWQYWQHSSPQGLAQARRDYSPLIRAAAREHEPLIAAAGAQALVQKNGYRHLFRTEQAMSEAAARADMLAREFGVRSEVQDGSAARRSEPALSTAVIGAIHWQEPWSVNDPGALGARYGELYIARGGQWVQDEALSLQAHGTGWRVLTRGQQAVTSHEAEHVVVALGPWSAAWFEPLGYRIPFFLKRGYHQHYRAPVPLQQPVLDAEVGYAMMPTLNAVRLTTGAELAPLAASPRYQQLAQAQGRARELLDLGPTVAEPVWMGARPCISDMLPVIGPAPKHPGLWFNFGHGHQGFTLGPVSGRLLAELITGETPLVDPRPYAPARF